MEIRKREMMGKKKQLPPRSAGRKVVDAILGVVVVACLVGAGILGWQALQPAEPVEAPVPVQDFDAIPAGVDPGPVEAEIDGQMMKPEDMAPGTLFIPALGVYMAVEQSESFTESKYAGFDSLRIPDDGQKGVWYSGGAPMYGGDEGATLIASHVTTYQGWGILRYLYTLTGGEMIYTKDYDGNLQSWQLTGMRTENHTDFPQEYWQPEGERYLVITTCGGPLTSLGTYQSNIFAIATPVDPLPRTPEQRAFASFVENIVPWGQAHQAAAAETAAREAAEPDGRSSEQDGFDLNS